MSYAFIRGHVDAFPVWAMCAALGVSRSGYYGWAGRPESARAAADRTLAAEIRAVHEGSRGRYGSPRVHAALRAHGRRVGRKRVARLMRGMGLSARRKRRFRRTTDSAHALPVAPNLLGRDFTAAPRRTGSGSPIYLHLDRARAGCTWPRWRTCSRAASSAGPWPTTSATNSRWPRSTWPSRAGAPRRAWSTTRTAGGNTPPRATGAPAGARHALLDEPQGRLLGQRADGELLRHPERRTRRRARLPHP